MAISGVEMMLRSLGLGEVITMAKTMEEKKTLQKVIAFADRLEDMQHTLERMKEFLDERDAHNALAVRDASAQAGSGSNLRYLPARNGVDGIGADRTD